MNFREAINTSKTKTETITEGNKEVAKFVKVARKALDLEDEMMNIILDNEGDQSFMDEVLKKTDSFENFETIEQMFNY